MASNYNRVSLNDIIQELSLVWIGNVSFSNRTVGKDGVKTTEFIGSGTYNYGRWEIIDGDFVSLDKKFDNYLGSEYNIKDHKMQYLELWDEFPLEGEV